MYEDVRRPSVSLWGGGVGWGEGQVLAMFVFSYKLLLQRGERGSNGVCTVVLRKPSIQQKAGHRWIASKTPFKCSQFR